MTTSRSRLLVILTVLMTAFLCIGMACAAAPALAADFTGTPTTGPAALTVQFTDTSAGSPTGWNWNFGDGGTSTVQNPSHTYTTSGTYSVTLEITKKSASDTVVKTNYISVTASGLAADFTATPTTGTAPLSVQFTDISDGSPTSWNWDFGDGQTSTEQNPVHVYSSSGTFTVSLTATNVSGSGTAVKTNYITVTAPAQGLVADFTGIPASGQSPLTVQFTDTSAGSPTKWNWNFGDGGTSTVRNPSHTYSTTGTYSVTLKVTKKALSDTEIKTDYISVNPGLVPPVAAFSSDVRTGTVPLTVQFTDASIGDGPLTYAWDFNNDGSVDSTLQNPSNQYTTAGTYTVRLTVTGPGGSDTRAEPDYITVTVPAPLAHFTGTPATGTAPLTVQFTDNSTNSPTDWNWDFGDGQTSSDQNPGHVYNAGGSFTVSLTATNAGGSDSMVITDYITVTAPVVISNFTANATAGNAPLTVRFTDNSIGSPTSWYWNFGDGNFSVVQHPENTFVTPGNFTVCLSVTNDYGMNDSFCRPEYIRVIAPAVVSNFTANATSGRAPLAVAFTDLSEGSPDSWFWNFGDGNYSVEQNPVHTYVTVGNHSVFLIASNGINSDNRTVAEYVKVVPATPPFNAEFVLNSMPTTMFQGEHYIVDIKVNNTGTETWYADPVNPNLVFLQGLGGASGDAAKFNITHIPMIFENETVAPGGSYDFFFYVKAPDTIGTYTPEYQVSSSAVGGTFGPVANATVNVIENPFHPVLQPDGSKLYTTTFGNASSGMSVSIVGPRVYIDDIRASSFNDPRFLINPTLKSGVFDFELNDSFTYANISISYDPAKVSNPANLSLGYFNETTGNYTFVDSAVDTINHRVMSNVTHFSTYGTYDKNQYQALPVSAQNEMGYIDIGSNDNWTVSDSNLRTPHTTWFNGMNQFPPGNYTILPSGYYHHMEIMGVCTFELYAYQNYYSSGPWVTYTNGSQVSSMVSTLVVPGDSNHALKFNHTGGPIGISIIPVSSQACGSLTYKLYYSDGPVFRDNEYDFLNELNNDDFNATELGYDLAVTAYQAAAGCVLGQAGQKGGYLDSIHSAIPGWNSAINDDVTESPAYLVGHVACAIALPEITLARDFTADVLRGDLAGASLNSLGYLGPVKTILKNSDMIPAFLIKNSKNVQAPTKLTKYLVDNGLIGASQDEAIGIMDKVFAGSASRLIDPAKNTADDLVNAALKGFDLKKVRTVVNAEGKTTVLTNDGLTHIIDRHITGIDLSDGTKMTSFWPLGYEVRPGISTPNVMTQTDVERLTAKCLKTDHQQ